MTLLLVTEGTMGNSALTNLSAPIEGDAASGAWLPGAVWAP